MTEKVAAEVAEAEFARFCETFDLDVDPEGMDDEDKQSFHACRRRMLRAIRQGQLAVNDEGEPVLTLSDGEQITFHEPTGATYMAMDQKKEGHLVARAAVTLAAMCKCAPSRFSKMKNSDFKICQAVLGLFMGG